MEQALAAHLTVKRSPAPPPARLGYHRHMTRVVGSRNRFEFTLDPEQAWRRGRVLDRMLAAAAPPVARGVTRAPHSAFNAWDDARQQAVARRLNRPQGAAPEA